MDTGSVVEHFESVWANELDGGMMIWYACRQSLNRHILDCSCISDVSITFPVSLIPVEQSQFSVMSVLCDKTTERDA